MAAGSYIEENRKTRIAGDYDVIHIAAEATGWYWCHFFHTLAHDLFLTAGRWRCTPSTLASPPTSGRPTWTWTIPTSLTTSSSSTDCT